MSRGAEIPIPASFSNQFTTFICVFRSGNYKFLRMKKHFAGFVSITFAWLVVCFFFFLISQICLYIFFLAESEKIFRYAYIVISTTVYTSTELSNNPDLKVVMNYNMYLWIIIMMTDLDMWPISVPSVLNFFLQKI